MKNQVNNSQSTAAVNSANITLNAWSMSETAWKSMEINDETFNEFKLSVDSLYMFLVRAISDSKINSCFILKDNSTQGCGYCFCFSKNEDGYIVVTEEWSGSDHEYYMGDRKRFTFGNINDFADRLCDIIADYYYGIYAAEENISETDISEAPVLDEAPCLEEDEFTEEGYSVAGLAYVRENTSEVYMDDIIKEVAEFHWDFESVVKESRWTRFTNDSFRELIWSTCWSEYLVAHTDEALEAETRYVMCFDSTYDDLFYELWPYMTSYDDSCGGCELWVDSWYAVERAAEIIEETATNYVHTRCICWDEFPNYMMTAFLGDLYGFETFTERVMSELEGGDIVDILPYDDGLYLSFVNDEAEVAA